MAGEKIRSGTNELGNALASLRANVGLPPAEESRLDAPAVLVHLPIDDLCEAVADLLKAQDGRWGLFRRGDEIGYIEDQRWKEMTPHDLITWLPKERGLVPVHKWEDGPTDPATGKRAQIPKKGEFNLHQATVMLKSRAFRTKLPVVENIHLVKMPVFRKALDERDGAQSRKGFHKLELLSEGFDLESRTLTLSSGMDYDENVPFEDAQKWLFDRVKYFPLGDSKMGSMEGSRSKAIIVSGMLTLFAARLFSGRSPMFALGANEPGSGKGVIARWMVQPVWGEPASAGWSHEDRKETRQSFDSVAQAFGEYIFFDNVPQLSKGQLKNADLERWLTQGRWGCRVLGTKRWFEGALRAATIMTANWPKFADDIERRTLLVDMYSPERSLDRVRPADQIDMDADWFADPANMKMTLSCLWALVRNWDEYDRQPIRDTQGKLQRPLASFEGWSKVIPTIGHAAGFGNALQRLDVPDMGNAEATQLEKLKVAVLAAFCVGAGKDLIEIELRQVVGVARRCHLLADRLWTIEGVLESEGEKGGFKYKEPPDKVNYAEADEKRLQAETWMSPGHRSYFGKMFKERLASGRIWRTSAGEAWLVGSRDSEMTNSTSKVVFQRQTTQA